MRRGERGEPAGDSEQERALADRARDDTDAFAELYRRYVRRVHAFAYRRCRASDVAEDITAATFERALSAMPSFVWRGGGFEAWLFRIAAHELADHYRRERRPSTARGQAAIRALHEPVSPAPDPEAGGDDDRVAPMLTALSTLRPRYQQAISLRYLSGLSHEQAAAAMECSKPVMAVLLHRAMAALRAAMGER